MQIEDNTENIQEKCQKVSATVFTLIPDNQTGHSTLIVTIKSAFSRNQIAEIDKSQTKCALF